jgi:hypothetical protein
VDDEGVEPRKKRVQWRGPSEKRDATIAQAGDLIGIATSRSPRVGK